MADEHLCPITGNEAKIDPKTPCGALAEFYCAYNKRDISLMEQNWLTSSRQFHHHGSIDDPAQLKFYQAAIL